MQRLEIETKTLRRENLLELPVQRRLA